VLTPHDAEFEALAGEPPGVDRFASVRSLAAELGAVVLLKGPCTIVADPAGHTLAVAEGDARLATAGTGDVLAGIIGALLGRGAGALEAAAVGAFVHARAGAVGWAHGLVATDLIDHLPAVLDDLLE
jgi:NAD(P)H-hydrate epimerase